MTNVKGWCINQVKSGVRALVTVALLNQLLYPPFAARRLSEWVHKEEPERIAVPAFTYLSFEETPQWNAREYLAFAHSLVWQYHNQEEHDCNYLSDATYDLYHELIGLHQRGDLEGKVRYASVPLEQPSGHMWLEIDERKNEGDNEERDEKEEWVPFETRNQTPALSPEQVAEYVRADKEYRKDIATEKEAEFVTLPGEFPLLEREIFYPKLKAFFYPGGLLRVMLKEYRGDYEKKE